jgi:hypothetical protein
MQPSVSADIAPRDNDSQSNSNAACSDPAAQ